LRTQALIIGGGVVGTGIARDLALRGVESLVVEKGDINAGASGSNHGLLHSGGRYVATDPGAARECHEENEILKKMAPHCIEDTGAFLLLLREMMKNMPRISPSAVPNAAYRANGSIPKRRERWSPSFYQGDCRIPCG